MPAFAFDGVENTHIKVTDKELCVEYRGYVCRYTTDGKFFDVKEDICNRNGRYRRFRALGDRSVSVKIEIEKL